MDQESAINVYTYIHYTVTPQQGILYSVIANIHVAHYIHTKLAA